MVEAPGCTVTACTAPAHHDAPAADGADGVAVAGFTPWLPVNLAHKSSSDVPAGMTVVVAPAAFTAAMQTLPAEADEASTVGFVMNTPACEPSAATNGALTLPPQNGVGGVVQSPLPDQPTKFCWACISRTATAEVEVFFTVNVKTAAGIADETGSDGINGVMHSHDTVTGKPSIS